jgi:hypothetical protein
MTNTNIFGLFTGKLLLDSQVEECLSKKDRSEAHYVVRPVEKTKKRTPPQKTAGFIFQVRKNRYIKSNCFFDVTSFEALSYDWWVFVKKIQDKVVFNTYSYSRSTSKHQSQTARLLTHLGIKIDISVCIKEGLQNYTTLKNLKKAG